MVSRHCGVVGGRVEFLIPSMNTWSLGCFFHKFWSLTGMRQADINNQVFQVGSYDGTQITRLPSDTTMASGTLAGFP